jgi:dUTPase
MANPKFMFCVDDGLDDSFLPTRAEPLSTGWDVKAAQDYEFNPFDKYKISLGIRAFIPDGWWLELRPRSSTFGKKNLSCLYGVIDQGYEGSILLACQYIPHGICDKITNSDWKMHFKFDLYLEALKIKKGEAIGQLVPVKRQEMDVESISKEGFEQMCKERGAKRGAGGFGSTDAKQ